jgi:hypothetical protein
MSGIKYLTYVSFLAVLAKVLVKEVDMATATTLGICALFCLLQHALLIWGETLKPKSAGVDLGPIQKKLDDCMSECRKAVLEVERQRDEQAKVHKIADETQKLLSQVNLGMGFRPFKKREQA